MQPYIGVTGVMNSREARGVLSALPGNASRNIMVGGLLSGKTIKGLTNKRPKRYPKPEALAEVFIDDPRALNLIHYATGDSLESVPEQLVNAMHLGGTHCHGMQLNMAWPDPADIGSFRVTYPDAVLVLQVGSRAMDKAGRDPKRVAARIKTDYGDLFDYVLIDPSGGFGREFVPEDVRPFVAEVMSRCPHVRCGLAGGLDAEALDRLASFFAEFPGICIDAEGRLRDENDVLDLGKTERYIIAATKTLR